MTATLKQSLRRAGIVAAVTLSTGAIVAVTPAPAAAAGCVPYVAILPFNHQDRDMAAGLPDGPLADRSSSGISFAESWQLLPKPEGHTVLRNRLVQQAKTWDATAFGGSNAVILRPSAKEDSDSHQWVVRTVNGRTTFTSKGTGLRITYVPGNAVPFQQQPQNFSGNQDFLIDDLGC